MRVLPRLRPLGGQRRRSRRDDELPLLRRYMADWRSLFPGGAAGILQLMYPPLGAAVAAQSGFFDDPFGRIYRSLPQIWATVLSPDGAERAREIRDLHRSIEGVDDRGRRYHSLDPETYWWAHATFTWNVFESIRLFHAGGTRKLDHERLYGETVGWYARYGVSMRPVPATYAAFRDKFDAVCRSELELTPAAARTLEKAMAGSWRPPLIAADFRDPITRNAGRIVVLGTLPPAVRLRFGIPMPWIDRRQFEAICAVIRGGFRVVPRPVNGTALGVSLRVVGSVTRRDRFVPPAA